MKKLTTIIAAAFLMTLGVNVLAQNTDNVDANASATIIAPITLTNPQPMNFGKIAKTELGGAVILSPAGERDFTGNADALVTVGSLHKNAIFTVVGEANTTFAISFTNGTLEGDGEDMTINAFTTNQSNNANVSTGTGTMSFNVGATLVVGAEQEAGEYTGTYEVTVTYN